MVLYCCFDLLRLDTDVPLCGECTAVLQQSLHQRNVKAVCIVDFRCVPLAKTVGTDTLVPQVIADNMKLLLHGSFCNGKHQVIPADSIPQTVILHILLNSEFIALIADKLQLQLKSSEVANF